MTEELINLPTRPGTIIAIGGWWLVRLRPYGEAPSAWELLPFPTKEATEHANRVGAKAQCVYDDAWVKSEVEQEGGFLVIAEPTRPYGVKYYRLTEQETR